MDNTFNLDNIFTTDIYPYDPTRLDRNLEICDMVSKSLKSKFNFRNDFTHSIQGLDMCCGWGVLGAGLFLALADFSPKNWCSRLPLNNERYFLKTVLVEGKKHAAIYFCSASFCF